MKRQLFSPFRIGQWARFAIVGFLAGEMGGGGGGGGNLPINLPSSQPNQLQGPVGIFPNFITMLAILAAVVLGIVLFFILLYVNSRMRFVLFDSLLAGQCQIRRFWRQRGVEGFRYFLWQLGFLLVTVLGLAILLVPNLVIDVSLGWFQDPRDHLAPLIIGG